MTREQFEAHVRAEALKKHPDAWIVTDQSIIDRSDYRRTYIAARMEHEWPLVEALQRYKPLTSNCHKRIEADGATRSIRTTP